MSGIIRIVTKAGMAISSLVQSISRTSDAIRAPTMIRAGEVTSAVMTPSSGEKNKAMAKHPEMMTEVNPVLPPAAIPELDSIMDAVVEVPRTEPTTVEAESARSARPAFGISLFFISPAWLAMAIRAPAVSKKATNRNVKMTASISGVNT
ncbi:Uncharacterised protein [Mycobacteroides abscessus subsp. abscessus]|nr:Uncharacterised protein [Mycobacteroides abscessus subsp. abscessus]